MLSAPQTPSAISDLGLGGSLSPDEIAARKKKLMAAGSNDPMAQFGNAAMALLGSRAAPAGV